MKITDITAKVTAAPKYFYFICLFAIVVVVLVAPA